MKLNENFFKPQIAIERMFIEGELQNYNLSEEELSKYLYKVYDSTGEKYGEEYIHDKDFDASAVRVLPIGTSLSLNDYDTDRITVFTDEDQVIIKAFRG
ncbi:MAG: hypothetical protein K0R02_536 [Rickettsiaceae bacterium]|jgi:hypothetical protein|nr:hypothetical protein [Rickettsiaceae bacterium]